MFLHLQEMSYTEIEGNLKFSVAFLCRIASREFLGFMYKNIDLGG